MVQPVKRTYFVVHAGIRVMRVYLAIDANVHIVSLAMIVFTAVVLNVIVISIKATIMTHEMSIVNV